MSQSTATSVDHRADVTELVERFLQDLERQEAAPRTCASYQLDLAHFFRWFEQTEGDAPTPEAVTPTDVREYRGHLLTVERRQPATVNRRLAALRRFFRWAKATGLAKEVPTENVKGVAALPRAPRWLEKREVDRLIRTVERHGTTRDLAIVLTLRHTGLRVSELCGLTRSGVEIAERKGALTVRSGKGGKFRVGLDGEGLVAEHGLPVAFQDHHGFLDLVPVWTGPDTRVDRDQSGRQGTGAARPMDDGDAMDPRLGLVWYAVTVTDESHRDLRQLLVLR